MGRDQAAVVKLRGDPAAFRMDGVHQPGQARQEAVIGYRGLLRLHCADGPRDARNAHDNQTRTTLRLRDMIVDQPLAYRAVLFGKADTHGRDDDSVGQGECADLPWSRERGGTCALSGSSKGWGSGHDNLLNAPHAYGL
jgi:hypothetical protein